VTARKQQLEARKPPIQKRAKATVDDILAASAQVFEEYGYAAGTTNRIAKRAGVSIGTVYQYFPSKEAIAVALLEQHVVSTTHHLHEWVGHMVVERHGLREALQDYVAGVLSMHAGSPRLQHILLEETTLPERVHLALLEAERSAANTMSGLLRVYPEIPRPRLEIAGFMVVQTVESLTHRFAAHPDQQQLVSQPRFIDELVAMLEAYLSFSETGEQGPRGQ
jgi:AcrR family transcriptional regulator